MSWATTTKTSTATLRMVNERIEPPDSCMRNRTKLEHILCRRSESKDSVLQRCMWRRRRDAPHGEPSRSATDDFAMPGGRLGCGPFRRGERSRGTRAGEPCKNDEPGSMLLLPGGSAIGLALASFSLKPSLDPTGGFCSYFRLYGYVADGVNTKSTALVRIRLPVSLTI